MNYLSKKATYEGAWLNATLSWVTLHNWLGGASCWPRRASLKNCETAVHRGHSVVSLLAGRKVVPSSNQGHTRGYPPSDIASGSGVHAEQRKASHRTPLWFVSCSCTGRLKSGLPLAENLSIGSLLCDNPTGNPNNLVLSLYDNGLSVGNEFEGDRRGDTSGLKEKKGLSQPSGKECLHQRGIKSGCELYGVPGGESGLSPSLTIPILSPTRRGGDSQQYASRRDLQITTLKKQEGVE